MYCGKLVGQAGICTRKCSCLEVNPSPGVFMEGEGRQGDCFIITGSIGSLAAIRVFIVNLSWYGYIEGEGRQHAWLPWSHWRWQYMTAIYTFSRKMSVAWPLHRADASPVLAHYVMFIGKTIALMSNEHRAISDHQQLYCFSNSLYRLTMKDTSKLHITGPMWGESSGFPSQRASNA